jgi:hypothetical protein
MKIGVQGCSHSSDTYGHPWHHYLGEKYGADIKYGASSGSGNEINIEKVKMLINRYPDMKIFILQLTDPTRFDFGIDNIDYEWEYRDKELGNLRHHTIRLNNNDDELKKHFINDYRIHDFFKNHVLASGLNQKYKIFHTMMSIQHICDFYGIKLIFMSWFVDLQLLANEINYGDVLDKMNVLDGSVVNFIHKNNIQGIPNNGHYGSEEHKRIFDEYINPQLSNWILGCS